MDELTVKALVENLDTVTDFVNERLEAADSSMKAQMQIDVALDELFSNIAYYAYGEETGMVTVQMEIFVDEDDGSKKKARITFVDSGVQFNPLEKEDPDVTLSADERGIGGLGIFMVKKTMDDVTYEYSEGKNRLTLLKTI